MNNPQSFFTENFRNNSENLGEVSSKSWDVLPENLGMSVVKSSESPENSGINNLKSWGSLGDLNE